MSEGKNVGFVFSDYRIENNIQKAVTYLSTLDLGELVNKASEVLKVVIEGQDSPLDVKFPDTDRPNFEHSIKTFLVFTVNIFSH